MLMKCDPRVYLRRERHASVPSLVICILMLMPGTALPQTVKSVKVVDAPPSFRGAFSGSIIDRHLAVFTGLPDTPAENAVEDSGAASGLMRVQVVDFESGKTAPFIAGTPGGYDYPPIAKVGADGLRYVLMRNSRMEFQLVIGTAAGEPIRSILLDVDWAQDFEVLRNGSIWILGRKSLRGPTEASSQNKYILGRVVETGASPGRASVQFGAFFTVPYVDEHNSIAGMCRTSADELVIFAGDHVVQFDSEGRQKRRTMLNVGLYPTRRTLGPIQGDRMLCATIDSSLNIFDISAFDGDGRLTRTGLMAEIEAMLESNPRWKGMRPPLPVAVGNGAAFLNTVQPSQSGQSKRKLIMAEIE